MTIFDAYIDHGRQGCDDRPIYAMDVWRLADDYLY